MQLIKTFSSPNHRIGIKFISNTITDIFKPIRASIMEIGCTEGHTIYQIEVDPTKPYIVIGESIEPINGCAKLESIRWGNVLICNEVGFAYKRWGYKQRSSEDVIYYKNEDGELERFTGDSSIALAMGLSGEKYQKDMIGDVEIPPIKEDNPFAAFLKSKK